MCKQQTPQPVQSAIVGRVRRFGIKKFIRCRRKWNDESDPLVNRFGILHQNGAPDRHDYAGNDGSVFRAKKAPNIGCQHQPI